MVRLIACNWYLNYPKMIGAVPDSIAQTLRDIGNQVKRKHKFQYAHFMYDRFYCIYEL
jgi:hypothetical protein